MNVLRVIGAERVLTLKMANANANARVVSCMDSEPAETPPRVLKIAAANAGVIYPSLSSYNMGSCGCCTLQFVQKNETG